MTRKVLVVDDSASMRFQVVTAVSRAGYACYEAENGERALEVMKKHEDIGIVLCDVNMPIMNGLQMLERKQRNTKIAHIPVVMMTTETASDLVEKALSCGAKGWLTKPFIESKLLATLSKALDEPQKEAN